MDLPLAVRSGKQFGPDETIGKWPLKEFLKCCQYFGRKLIRYHCTDLSHDLV